MVRLKAYSVLFIVLLVMFPSLKVNAGMGGYRTGDLGPAHGLVFYMKANYSNGWRYLEAAPEDQSVKAYWGCYDKAVPGATYTDTGFGLNVDIGNGYFNTEQIVKGCEDPGIAAKLCDEYTYGGYDDWYLPSREELNLMYTKLSQNALGGFAKDNYWSSSEFMLTKAWAQHFGTGYQDYYVKGATFRVRAIRKF